MKTSKLPVTILVVLCVACAPTAVETLSSPEEWNGDYMYDAEPTASCQTDTITSARTRMRVEGPYTIVQYEQTVAHEYTTVDEPDIVKYRYNEVSDFVRENLGNDDEIFAVSFQTDPASGDFWGFFGYVVARDECVIHVSKMGYLN